MYSKKDKENMKEYLSERFPKNSRDKFWFIASGAKREMLTFPNYYNNILNNYPDYIPCLFEQTIDKDLTRTFPEFNQIKKYFNGLFKEEFNYWIYTRL